MFARASQAAADDFALGRADHQAAGDLQETPSGSLFELPPQLIRSPQQRHVRGMLEIREPDHARSAVTRSLIVRRLELFEAEDALAARRGMRRGGAAHAAKPDDDHDRNETRRCRMPSMARLLVLFFASGCAALIYETVWFYLVQLVVGASSISVAVLLCAFMGGMALGSWLLPKLTPKGTHPFRVVAALEVGIAIFGIAIPLALPYIQQVYLTLAEPGAGAITLRAVVCFLVLTPPTMLMGATLPAIARWQAQRARRGVGRHASTWPTSPAARPARCSPASTCCASTTRSSRPRSRSRSTSIIAVAFWLHGRRSAEARRVHASAPEAPQAPEAPEAPLAPDLHRRGHSRASRRSARRWSGRGSCRCCSAPASTRSR